MADCGEKVTDVSEKNNVSGFIVEEPFGLQMRKKATVSRQPDYLRIAEGNDGDTEEKPPENIGFVNLSSEVSAPDTDSCPEPINKHKNPTNNAQPHPDIETDDINTTKLKPPLENISVFSYLYAELTRGYLLEQDGAKLTEKRERIYTFIKIPRELEKFMLYGFFQCADAFLYIFTFLPLRFLMAFIKLCIKGCLSSWVYIRERRSVSMGSRILEAAEICDLIKGFVLIACCLMMNYVDVSMMYHIIRGQAMIKLYLFYNMLEVADRLFSSFGQDILDSCFWTATEPRGRKREHFGIIPHLLLAILYVFLHAVLVLFQATTLNVAFNSHNKALLTIMMSNNFVELKGSVFKKFEKTNLFQMSCSDVRERFHLIILLTIVCIRNLTEFSWQMDHLLVLIPDVVFVMLAEVMVDWVKHAFITKFNEIPYEVYRQYTVSIAYDMSLSKQKNASADHVDVVSRRMGFIPLPLAAVLVRVIIQSLRVTQYFDILLVVLFYLCLVSLKVLNSIVLLGQGVKLINETKEAKRAKEKQAASNNISPISPIKEKAKLWMRSQSVGDNMNITAIMNHRKSDGECELQDQPWLTRKPMFSNSMVSLPTVALNEDFVKDREGTPSLVAIKDEKSKTPSPKPLHEVDRYTMCSNRII